MPRITRIRSIAQRITPYIRVLRRNFEIAQERELSNTTTDISAPLSTDQASLNATSAEPCESDPTIDSSSTEPTCLDETAMDTDPLGPIEPSDDTPPAPPRPPEDTLPHTPSPLPPPSPSPRTGQLARPPTPRPTYTPFIPMSVSQNPVLNPYPEPPSLLDNITELYNTLTRHLPRLLHLLPRRAALPTLLQHLRRVRSEQAQALHNAEQLHAAMKARLELLSFTEAELLDDYIRAMRKEEDRAMRERLKGVEMGGVEWTEEMTARANRECAWKEEEWEVARMIEGYFAKAGEEAARIVRECEKGREEWARTKERVVDEWRDEVERARGWAQLGTGGEGEEMVVEVNGGGKGSPGEPVEWQSSDKTMRAEVEEAGGAGGGEEKVDMEALFCRMAVDNVKDTSVVSYVEGVIEM